MWILESLKKVPMDSWRVDKEGTISCGIAPLCLLRCNDVYQEAHLRLEQTYAENPQPDDEEETGYDTTPPVQCADPKEKEQRRCWNRNCNTPLDCCVQIDTVCGTRGYYSQFTDEYRWVDILGVYYLLVKITDTMLNIRVDSL